jgi:signal transduction histidine kinase
MGIVRTRRRLPVRALSTVAAGLVVFGAALLPGDPGPGGYLSELTGMEGRPVAAALLGAAAGAATWRSSSSRRTLVALAVLSPLVDSTAAGVCLALAAIAFARYNGRVRLLAGFLAWATSWSVLPAAVGLVAGSGTVQDSSPSAIGGVVYVWAPFVLGLWLAARQHVLEQMLDRAERLQREQEAVADRARARERARIAHDMHDVVAHRVSLMVLQAGALEVNATDPATAESAELIRATGAEALGQLRDVLGLLREDGAEVRPTEVRTLAGMDDLVQESVDAGLPVRLHRTGIEPDGMPLRVEQTVYRAAREALTNIHKHAGSVRSGIDLDIASERITLRVHNDPPAGRPGLPGAGTGLIALHEAVSLLDGEMTAGAREDGGFELHVAIPFRTTCEAAP